MRRVRAPGGPCSPPGVHRHGTPARQPTRAGRPAAFAHREFVAVWSAAAISGVGSQVSRVALAVLVFGRTGSAPAAVATLLVGFLPDLLAGPTLAHLADRHPRRHVAVVSDLLCAGLTAAMVLPGLPVWTLLVLMASVGCAAAPGRAARSATLPDILPAASIDAAVAIRQTTDQLGQVVGNPFGAVLAAAVGPPGALALDALSFGLSALITLAVVRLRPAPSPTRAQSTAHHLTNGIRLVARSARLRALLGLACLHGIAMVPEGLVVPLAAQLRVGVVGIAWLWAALPAGMTAGILVLQRSRTWQARSAMRPLALAMCLALIPTALAPALPPALALIVTVAVWTLCGVASSYMVTAQAAYLHATPDRHRGQALGLAQATLRAAHAVCLLGAAAAAMAVAPTTVVGAAGVAGAGLAMCGTRWRRESGLPNDRLHETPP